MKPEKISDDPDMQQATAALIRAGKRARQIAQQTGTAVVVIRDGKLIRDIQKSSPTEQARTDITE